MFSEFFLLILLFHTNATKIRVIIKQVIEMHIKYNLSFTEGTDLNSYTIHNTHFTCSD